MSNLSGSTLVSAICGVMLFVSSDTYADCDGARMVGVAAGCETAQSLRDQDSVLNRYYESLMQGLSKRDKTQVRQTQRAWLRERDVHCRLDSKARSRELWFQAIADDPDKLVCVIWFTQDRLAALESRYGNRGVLNARKFEAEPKADWAQDGDPESRQKMSRAVSKGKFYLEVSLNRTAIVRGTDLQLVIGIFGLPDVQASDPSVPARRGHSYFTTLTSGSTLSANATGNKIIGVAADLDNGMMYLHNNGKWLDGEPGAISGLELEPGLLYRAGVSSNIMVAPMIERGLLKVNFGMDEFRYPLPPGYQSFESAADN